MSMEVNGKPVVGFYVFPDLIQRLCQRLVFVGSETLATQIRLRVISGGEFLWGENR